MTTSSTSTLGSVEVEEGEEGDQLYRKLDDVDEISLDYLELTDLIKEGEKRGRRTTAPSSTNLNLLHASQILVPTETLELWRWSRG